MPTLIPATASAIFNRARFFLNDRAANIYNDTVLIEPLNASIDDLREELQDNDASLVQETSAAISIPAGVTSIGGGGSPLPNDLLVPVALWERTAGTTNDYMQMQKRHPLPKTQTITAFLIYWNYQNQVIKFLGATSDLEVKIDYIANRLFDTVSASSQVDMKQALSFLGTMTAGYAAEFIGENKSRADSLYQRAGRALELVINLDVKNKQNQPHRRRPFMANYKRRGGLISR